MVPPAKVNKFIKRSLNLKGKAQAAQTKGWERRKGTCDSTQSGTLTDRPFYCTANVGVMKRNGPAASFARNGGYP